MIYANKIIGVFILLFSSLSIADTLIMKDGSVLKGRVYSQEANTLKFDTVYAGTIDIKWDQVKDIKTEKPVTIMLATDELISTKSVSKNDNGASQIIKEGEEKKTVFQTENISYINPEPWRLGQGYKISARANVSLKSQHGNTIKDEFEMDGELKLRRIQDRYTLEVQLENDTNRDETTADNWLLRGQYDYFLTKKRYLGMELSFERDRFTDLDLRTIIGPHVGHQFYESHERNLATDIGLVKVYDNNIDADDTDYLGINWNINYDQYFFNNFTQFYHKQKGLWDWEKSNKKTWTSWTGFRFPLRYGVVFSTEVEWEYDSKPNPSVHKSDTTYRFKLGYQL